MAYTIINGRTSKASSGFIKRRVSFVAGKPFNPADPGMEMQMIGGFMMVQRLPPVPNIPPRYRAPVAASWANLMQTYPEQTAGLHLIGVLIAELGGPFEGHIDWVQQISEDERREVVDGL